MTVEPVTWKTLVTDVVSHLGATFELSDVLKFKEDFARAFPNNRFIEAKIRQSLQILRDQGKLRFLGNGRYERLDVEPIFSPLIDFTVANEYASAAQVARVALETWASFNLYCLNCDRTSLDRLPDGTPVADFGCLGCGTLYQLKSKNGRFGARIAGAAYKATLEAVRAGAMPEYVLVEYDTRFKTAVYVDAIRGRSIGEDRVVPRKPLSAKAKRAGWQGCTLIIAGLPTTRIVAPAGRDQSVVRKEWRSASQIVPMKDIPAR